MNYKFLGLPLHYGADSIGLNFGIDALKKELQKKECDMIEKITIVNENENFEYKDIKYINSIAQNCENLAFKVNEAIKKGEIPISIGGDHSIAMGSISGVAKEMEIGIIWVDAHGDMNTPETTVTGNIHGMPLAAVQGYGHDKLINIFYAGPKIKSQNIVIFGARNFDYREKMFIEELGIKVVYYKDIIENGFNLEFTNTVEYLTKNVSKIHMSFDLDVIDPKYLPGVSIPVESGISTAQAEYIFDYFIENELLSSLDLVEYNPVFDINHVTRDFVIKLLHKFK
jgi:arginase